MLASVFCASVLALGLSPDTSSQQAPDQQLDLLAIEENIVYYTNLERERRGLRPLEIDSQLMETSRRHAAWMTNRQSLTHSHIGVGENIAVGQPTSEDVVHRWMNSRGHRANILNGSYTKIGVAAYQTESGRIYWCQQFMW